jgi:hypothetical protein
MNSKENNLSFWNLFCCSIPKIPWKGFIYGLFIPLMIMHIFEHFQYQLIGIAIAVAVCVIFFVIDITLTKWPCIFPLITTFMVITQYAAGVHAAYHPQSALAMSLVPGVDNGLVGLFFLGSLFTKTPLILFLLDKETVERMPVKIKKTPYYLKAWSYITLTWGIAFIIESLLLTTLHIIHSPYEKFLNFVFSWPLVLVLLFFSVMFPSWYWTKNAADIK